MNQHPWTAEYITEGEVHRHKIKEYLYVTQSPHQKLEIVETDSYGRGLLLDGRLQHVALDEYIYSESMVHPLAMILGNRCKKVLVVGGGPGGVIRELLKHNTIESITQIEIDAMVIDLTKKYFQHIANYYHEDPRVNIIIADVNDYIAHCSSRFDLVIYDVSEPLQNSPAQDVFSVKLLKKIRRSLSAQGAFVTWAGSAGPCSSELSVKISQRIRSLFPYSINYLCHTQSYGTSWLIAVGMMKKISPFHKSPREINIQISKQVSGTLRLYDGITHHHMFLLPKDVRTNLQNRQSKPRDTILLTHLCSGE